MNVELEMGGNSLPVVGGVIVLTYVVLRSLGARRRGRPIARAAGRAAAESIPTVAMVGLGLMLLVMGVTLAIAARGLFGGLREISDTIPVFGVFAAIPIMFLEAVLWPAAIVLVVAGALCLLGGGGLVTGFWAARRARRARRRHRGPEVPAPVSAPTPAPAPAPAPSGTRRGQPSVRQRPLRAAGR